jgi:hypothetical protein
MQRHLRLNARLSANFEAERDSAEHLNLVRPAARRSFPWRVFLQVDWRVTKWYVFSAKRRYLTRAWGIAPGNSVPVEKR